MERLTDRRTAEQVRENIEKLQAAGFEVSISDLRYVKLAEYEEVAMNKTEELIGIFGALCDYMVDNGRCDVFCPYAETKDKDDECEAWRTIQKIRQEDENE